MKDRIVIKALILGIIISFIGAGVIPNISGTVGNFSTITSLQSSVNIDKSILYVGGPGAGNYTSIQDAINDASNGDTVFVFDNSSPYYENIVVDKTINLIGENRKTTVIDGGGFGNVVDITVDLVNISGFTIQNSGGESDNGGIRIGSDFNTISDNNISSNNMDGIIFDVSNDNTISDNYINLNGDDAIVLYDSNRNIISNNIISFNDDCGIIIYYPSEDNIISSNTIRSNNEDGLYVNATNNYIYHNNFIHNLRNANDEGGNNWDNGYPSGGNYWSDYIGLDNFHGPNQDKSGSDGIGDTIYEIPCEHGTDNYPFMEQYGWFNEPPNSPTLVGPSKCNAGTEYYFRISSYDPDGEDVYFWIDWGDGDIEVWIGPYEPNEEEILYHTWDTRAPYIIKAKAKDESGAESAITEFTVEITRSRTSYNLLLLRLFERFQAMFPILRLLL